MKDYVVARKEKTIWKYGLVRRTEAVAQQFQRFELPKPCVVLDIGTADGLMLRDLAEHYGLNHCIGIGLDTTFDRLQPAKENLSCVMQADGRRLPLCTSSVDIIVAAAVLKHVKGLEDLLVECRRVLRPGSIMIATDPTPLGIYLGLLLGHFTRQEIAQILGLRATRQMWTRYGFKLVYAGRFMLSPVPFIGSDTIEKALKRAHLDQLFFNQVICAKSSVG